MIKIKRGLSLPISGLPDQKITEKIITKSVGLVGVDYNGMKPTMSVSVGESIKKGQLIFTDKKNVGVRYTSPVSGIVSSINRGEKRILESVVIEREGERECVFKSYNINDISQISADEVEKNLNDAGLWTSIRTRPYSKAPALNSRPKSIFITAMDTHPLALEPSRFIRQHVEAFETGISLLGKFSKGNIFVCKAPKTEISVGIAITKEFDGPHPAGLPGTHIHFLDPVSLSKTVWYVNYQDVIAIGYLFLTGNIFNERLISLAGPQVKKPRLIQTILGVDIQELTNGELKQGNNRLISGSVFGGRTCQDSIIYLGRYHNQISVLENSEERLFLSWLNPTVKSHSVKNLLFKRKEMNFTTTTNGSERAILPIGQYEQVMPLDILPTQLLRSIVVEDTDQAQRLGVLDLDEEDLALCTYVCAGKYEYGPILRKNLTRIEIEG